MSVPSSIGGTRGVAYLWWGLGLRPQVDLRLMGSTWQGTGGAANGLEKAALPQGATA